MPTSRRSDARRNRTAILRAADEALTRGSEPLPLPEIARLAGLGRATVYRHFPDRRALAVAVMGQQLAALGCLVEELADDPGGFREILRAVLTAQATMRPLVVLLGELPAGDQRRNAAQLVEALRPSLERAQAAGLVRPDVQPADLTMLLGMLEGAVTEAEESYPEPRSREAALSRSVDLLVNGICGPAT